MRPIGTRAPTRTCALKAGNAHNRRWAPMGGRSGKPLINQEMSVVASTLANHENAGSRSNTGGRVGELWIHSPAGTYLGGRGGSENV